MEFQSLHFSQPPVGMITDNNLLSAIFDSEFPVYNFVPERAVGLQGGNFATVPILSAEILYFEGNSLADGSMEEYFLVRPTNQHFYGYQIKKSLCRPTVHLIVFKSFVL